MVNKGDITSNVGDVNKVNPFKARATAPSDLFGAPTNVEEETKRPTIDQLDAILNSENDVPVKVMPDGSIKAEPSMEELAMDSAAKSVAVERKLKTDGFKNPQPLPPGKTDKAQAVSIKSRTGKEVTIANLTEEDILDFPMEIKSLNDMPMMEVKPKDSSLIFRWVYCGTKESKGGAQNVARTKYKGFEFASIDDVEGGIENMLDGILDADGKIYSYDTVLMKINKLRLMGHYKASLVRSLKLVDDDLESSRRMAEGEIKGTGAYRKAMQTHPQAKVEFYRTS